MGRDGVLSRRRAVIGLVMALLAGAAARSGHAALPCGAPSGRIDLGDLPLQEIAGDTSTGTNGASSYPCVAGTLDGPELVYELILSEPGHVVAVQTSGVAGLELLILSACDETTCLGAGCGAQLPAGTSYLVVDGVGGAGGPFELLVAYEPPFDRWSSCEAPYGSTRITDTSEPWWNFDDGAYCYSDPASYNYPDGCTFAMYAVVQCGTAMHIPLFDVESCHLRIFDVLEGQHVELSAVSTGGWSMTGYEIGWQDCDGTDNRWNEQVTDISFRDSAGLCGLFRLEFENHAGFIWELYANCTGARMPQFNIHDSSCGALAEHRPLPSLSLVSATVTEDCPEVTVTYTVLNDGCAVARDVPVQLLEDGAVIATDVVPDAPSGQTTTHSFDAVVSGTGAPLVLVIDPDDVVVECVEVSGASCEPLGGLEQLPLSACAPDGCSILPAVTGPPGVVCAGSTVAIDAGASGGLNCAGGVLQYRFRSLEGVLEPWGDASELDGHVVTRSVDCFVDVRCSSQPDCVNSVRLRVDVERPPQLDPLSVRATSLPCEGIAVDWTPARFFGPTGTGFYNVHRSGTSCTDAVSRAPIASGLTAPGFVDPSTIGGATYYYVVEAEDATPATACAPRGSVVGGACTRVDAAEGACQGVVDLGTARPDLFPHVGGSLRLGGSSPAGRRYGQHFVELDWMPGRPLDVAAGEHFHVLRSERPEALGAPLAVEPPRLVVPTFRDASADDTVGDVGVHVWHYVILVADGCERDDRAYDGR